MSEWLAKELNQENFYQEINRDDYPVFVDFWAAWCPPCRMMDPLINQLAEEYEGQILVRKLNTDLYHIIAEKFEILGVPTYIIFKKGQEIWRKVGAFSKTELQKALKALF